MNCIEQGNMLYPCIEVGDTVVLKVGERKIMVDVTSIAGIGLWTADNGMYFERKHVIEIIQAAPKPKFQWANVLRNFIILLACTAIIIGMYYNGQG